MHQKGFYKYLLIISFLSSSMNALITFPRSLYLLEKGISIASYGILISCANGILCFLTILLGKLIDRYRCLIHVLFAAFLTSLCCHACFLLTDSGLVLGTVFILEFTAYRIFSVFIFQLVAEVAGSSFGKGLGAYKVAGSLAWALSVTASGYVMAYLDFHALVAIILLLGAVSIILLFCLNGLYQKGQRPDPAAKKPSEGSREVLWTLPLVNALFLYALMQFQSNGGFHYLQIYLTTELEIGELTSGYILSASGIFEIAISMALGMYCDVRKKQIKYVLMVCGLLSAVRWILLSSLSITLTGLVVTQFLHGVMICTLSIVFISYFKTLVGIRHLGTVMGLAGSLGSLCTIFAASAFGAVGEYAGLSNAYLLLGIVGAAGTLLFAVVELYNKRKSSLRETQRKKGGSIL